MTGVEFLYTTSGTSEIGWSNREYTPPNHISKWHIPRFTKELECLTEEAYALYMSFHKMVFYLKDADVKIRCDHGPFCKSMYSVTKNEKLNNCSQEIHAIL